LLTLLAVGASAAAATPAHAQSRRGEDCDDRRFIQCFSKGSVTSGELVRESREVIKTNASITANFGEAKANATFDIGPYPKSSEPLWKIDIARANLLRMSWPLSANGDFELGLEDSLTSNGTFQVKYSLLATAGAVGEIGPFTFLKGLEYDWTKDLERQTDFRFRASNDVRFDAFRSLGNAINNEVPPPILEDRTLFSTSATFLGFTGNAKFVVDTRPNFRFSMTRVLVEGAEPITSNAPIGRLAKRDANALDLVASIEGEIVVTGMLGVKLVGSNGDDSITVAQIPLAESLPFTSETVRVVFPSTTIHIPLANIKLPKEDIEIAKVKRGEKAEKVITVRNTGELEANLRVESSDQQFQVLQRTATIPPGGELPLTIRFTPGSEGDQATKITVRSNDPDEPVQEFSIRAGGPTLGGGSNFGSIGTAGAPDDSGCGCRTVASASRHSSSLAFAGVGVALAGLVARRRRNRAA